jgi:hypothetical protein
MQTIEYDVYAVQRDAATIARFLSRLASHSEKLAAWRLDSNANPFPKPIGKDAKWPAYEAAGRIIRTLNINCYATSVEDLAIVLGKALAAR